MKRNEIYLLGRKTVVFTDHKPLLTLGKFRDVVNKRFRWISYLEELGIILKHVKGADNVIADYISRNPKNDNDVINFTKFASIEFIEQLTQSDDILVAQRNDEKLKAAMEWIESQKGDMPKEFAPHKQKLQIHEGVLYYRHHHGRKLVVAPDSYKQQILCISHNHFSGGHFGIHKSHHRVLETFWWPKLFDQIKTHVANCEICIKVKALGKKRAKVGIRGWPKKPLDLISIDYLTDLPETARHNKHILVINDRFSRYLQVYPVKDRTAETASTVIVDYILRFGIPMKLYSDRDPSYESNLFQNVMRQMGIKKLRTTGYNPQANGLTEQSNSTIKNFLTSYVNETPQDWDLYCRELSFAYNTSMHSSTGFAPATLFFGRKLNAPLDLLFGTVDTQNELISDVDSLKSRIQAMYDLARRNSIARQDVYASYYDKKVLDDPIEVGTLVYVFLPRNNRIKLALKWMGPAKVLRNHHPSYEIEIRTEKGVHEKWVTRNKLKRAPKDVVDTEIDTTERTAEQDPNGGVSSDSEDNEPKASNNRKTYNLRDRVRWRRDILRYLVFE